jgi:hypothetical protein
MIHVLMVPKINNCILAFRSVSRDGMRLTWYSGDLRGIKIDTGIVFTVNANHLKHFQGPNAPQVPVWPQKWVKFCQNCFIYKITNWLCSEKLEFTQKCSESSICTNHDMVLKKLG